MGAKSASVGFLVQPVTSRWPRARAARTQDRAGGRASGQPGSSPTAVLRAGRGIPAKAGGPAPRPRPRSLATGPAIGCP
jgi:hypothetical protein